MDQPTSAPTQKVSAAGIAGAVSIVLVYIVGLFGLELPPEVASSVTLILSFSAGYLVREPKPQVIVKEKK